MTRVGADSYASRINAEAKYVKGAKSEIMSTLNMIIRWATWLLAPVGILLFLRTLQDGSTINQSILTTVAALVGMIPQGLVLLTSSVLAISTARLARKSVLIQQFYCIEMLARVDVLCLDKTGTITSGSMDFEKSVGVDGHDSSEVELAAAAIVHASAHDANETATALIRHAAEVGIVAPEPARAHRLLEREEVLRMRLGRRSLARHGSRAVRILQRRPRLRIQGALSGGGSGPARSVVAECDGFDKDGSLIGLARPLGILSLSDHIRSSAPETIAYFVDQGVTLNVISGDDPRTVSGIARRGGRPRR